MGWIQSTIVYQIILQSTKGNSYYNNNTIFLPNPQMSAPKAVWINLLRSINITISRQAIKWITFLWTKVMNTSTLLSINERTKIILMCSMNQADSSCQSGPNCQLAGLWILPISHRLVNYIKTLRLGLDLDFVLRIHIYIINIKT